ncbi:MAG: NADH-quinone oxidoreductase subunit C [bacterium]|nr:NADH-quinone oxidoreductase subunit C [bacterium]
MVNPDTITRLQAKFPEAIEAITSFRDEWTVELFKEFLIPVCQFLKDEPDLAYHYLSDLCGVDYLNKPRLKSGQTPRFEIVYQLYSHKLNERVRLKIKVDESESVPSVTSVWQGANWLEREVFDQFGIKFDGHPDLRRILNPDHWETHPLRKDYPLRGLDEPFMVEPTKNDYTDF